MGEGGEDPIPLSTRIDPWVTGQIRLRSESWS